jgi:hypothetical protein
MYSITLKPQQDTPEGLREYAIGHGVKPGWLFLTGKPNDIETLRGKLDFVDSNPVRDREKSKHIGVVLYGNEALDRWAACPALLTHHVAPNQFAVDGLTSSSSRMESLSPHRALFRARQCACQRGAPARKAAGVWSVYIPSGIPPASC